MLSCCEYHKKTECGQGDNCPDRNRTCPIATTYAETDGVMTMPTGCSTKALPDPKRQPLPVIDPPTSIRPTLKWFAVLIVYTALSALCVLHGTRFFN